MGGWAMNVTSEIKAAGFIITLDNINESDPNDAVLLIRKMNSGLLGDLVMVTCLLLGPVLAQVAHMEQPCTVWYVINCVEQNVLMMAHTWLHNELMRAPKGHRAFQFLPRLGG